MSTANFHLKNLTINDFRNISRASLEFGPKFNLFIGENGQGKTNTLEAIALACSLKPLKPLKNFELIKYNKNFARLKAAFFAESTFTIDIDVLEAGKKVKLNEKPLRKALHHRKRFPIVSFIPTELNMIDGSSSLRRRALDHVSASLFFEHIETKKRYDKALFHRNKLLKQNQIDESMFKTFTTMLIKEGADLIINRLKAIKAIEKLFINQLKLILNEPHEAFIAYKCDKEILYNEDAGQIETFLHDLYTSNKSLEHSKRVTLYGPHLDDVVFFINNLNAKHTASRGQSRAIVLAFKIAQILAIKEMRDINPLVILDDIISELDEHNKDNLISLIKDLSMQAFFSATSDEAFLKNNYEAQILKVEKGIITPK